MTAFRDSAAADAEYHVAFEPLRDLESLRRAWLLVEQQADATFFSSWAWTGTWIGLLPAQRWPLVCRITRAGQPIALAVFGQRRIKRMGIPYRQLLMNASGSDAHDSIHVEMNQLLACHDCELLAWRALLNSLLSGGLHAKCDELLLPGLSSNVPVDQVAADCRLSTHVTEVPAPYVDLDRLRSSSGYAALLPADGRKAVRRALRDYSRSLGEPDLIRAGTATEAEAFLTALVAFHQRYWQARGELGAFAEPEFHEFHRRLIRNYYSHGCLDLFRIQCGDTIIAYVYAFRYREVASLYQCGYNYAALPAHNQPGYLALPSSTTLHLARAPANSWQATMPTRNGSPVIPGSCGGSRSGRPACARRC
jgi:Acetyltransferase (GNAT) domain